VKLIWGFKALLGVVALIASTVILPAGWLPLVTSSDPFDTRNEWAFFKVGSGGATQKLDIVQSDNTMLVGADQYGCYLYNASTSAWVNLLTTNKIPALITALGIPDNAACNDARAAPSNTNHIWISALGKLFKTTDRGATFTELTNFPSYPSAYENVHSTFTQFQPWIAIDPANTNVVLVGTTSLGIKYTNDGGATFSTLAVPAGLPESSTPTTGVGTDSTNVTTCTGVVSFSNNSGSFGFAGGDNNYAQVWETSNPANSMWGSIHAASGTTFSLTVLANFGTCSHSDWTVGGENRISGGGTVAFDPSSAVTGGKTQGIYSCSFGIGVYHSTDGGTTWSLTASGPTLCAQIQVAPNGTVWQATIIGDGSANLWKYSSGTWTHLTTPTAGIIGFAIDPSHCASDAACHQIIVSSNYVAYTENGGGAWNVVNGIGPTTNNFAAAVGQPGWVAALIPNGFGFYPGGARFDSTGKVFVGGEGPFWFTPSTSATTNTINVFSNGIEEWELNQVAANPLVSGQAIMVGWDIGCIYKSVPPNNNSNTLGCYTPYPSTLRHGYSLDYGQAADPNFVIVLADNQGGYGGGGTYTSYSGTSLTGGVDGSWSALNIPPISTACSGAGCKGGNVCASTKSNYIFMPTDGNGGAVFPYYTTDGGAHWTQITISGVTPVTGWPASYLEEVKQCAADPTTVGKFYLYNWNTNDGVHPGDAIITCTAGGATCSWTSHPNFANDTQFAGRLKAAPNGDLWFSSGQQAGQPRANPLYYSTNGGAAWSQATGFANVTAFGFGVAFPTKTYAALYAVGWFTGTIAINGSSQSVSSRYGTYMCKEFNTGAGTCNTTWDQTGSLQYPLNWAQDIIDMDGDKITPGLVYATTILGGAFYGKFSYADVGASLSCSYTPNTSATYNVAYTGGTPSPSGGTSPYSYTVTTNLPTGMTMSSGTGIITGTDSTDSGGATYPGIQVVLHDNVSNTANCGTSFTITVSGSVSSPTVTSSASNAVAVSTVTIPTIHNGDVVICLRSGYGTPTNSTYSSPNLGTFATYYYGANIGAINWKAYSGSTLTNELITTTEVAARSIKCISIAGANITVPFDTVGVSGPPTASNSGSLSITTTHTTDLVFSMMNGGTTDGSPWVDLGGNGYGDDTQYRSVTSTGTYTASFGGTTGQPAFMFAVKSP